MSHGPTWARRWTTRSNSISCARTLLTPASAVALTLRAVGGLTTRRLRKPTSCRRRRWPSGSAGPSGPSRAFGSTSPAMSLRAACVLYLVFNEGYSGDVDLAAEAIRLARQLATRTYHEEVAGLLALMLLHHARRAARTGPDGRLVPLAEQDRSRWDTRLIAEGVDVLQAALARDRLGEFQAQAAIAALHADARTAEETDWAQIVEWYDELVRLTDSPVARSTGPSRSARPTARRPVWRPGGTRSGPAPLRRRRGIPARARWRRDDCGTALRRGRPGGTQPPRTRPPHATGRAAQRAAARASVPLAEVPLD
ncbi:MAG: DUF6596 domain-containing protein [Thermomicrobiales bacterium]